MRAPAGHRNFLLTPDTVKQKDNCCPTCSRRLLLLPPPAALRTDCQTGPAEVPSHARSVEPRVLLLIPIAVSRLIWPRRARSLAERCSHRSSPPPLCPSPPPALTTPRVSHLFAKHPSRSLALIVGDMLITCTSLARGTADGTSRFQRDQCPCVEVLTIVACFRSPRRSLGREYPSRCEGAPASRRRARQQPPKLCKT